MRRLRKGLVAGAVGLAVLVPTGLAVADTVTPNTTNPVCTAEQRADRWAVRDQLRTQVLDQLRQEGVTDPAQVRDQLRTRVHDAMQQQFGEVNGPNAGARMGHGGGGGGGQHLGPMDGTGNGRGATS